MLSSWFIGVNGAAIKFSTENFIVAQISEFLSETGSLSSYFALISNFVFEYGCRIYDNVECKDKYV